MRALIEACARPLAAPSANASGRISATSAEHVAASLGGRISLILDAGPTERGLESTIIGIGEDGIRLLRPGPIDLADLLLVAGIPEQAASGAIEAPGQLRSHYAPIKPLRLEARAARADEWLIGFGIVEGDDNLSPAGDLDQAAARLFEALHRAEASAKSRIAVASIPHRGIGRTINDRLTRAATQDSSPEY
jgi:L-threonylcarbamoyladenylate synthase